MINSKQMHYGYSHRNQNCTFICFLFHPNLFTQNTLLYQNYIHPVIQASSMDYLLFSRENPSYRTVCTLMTNILELKEEGHIGYELEVIGKIHQLWNIIFHYYKHNLPNNDFDLSPDLAAQKNMVSYICQHYQEKLSLSDIASAGNVCRSKCCMIFKRYLQQSPIEFLNYYRLEISLNLLKNTTENITNIALTCGFNHLSYYSKLFFRRYGCTPRNYRRQYSKNYKGRV